MPVDEITKLDLTGKRCLVTGAAQGIGLALCRELRSAGAGDIIMIDRDSALLGQAAAEVDGVAMEIDLADASAIDAGLNEVRDRFGVVSVLFSNAGVLHSDSVDDGSGAPDEQWQQCWDINYMAHVRLVRQLLPAMLVDGGWIVLTASAAGLLALPDSATYSVTKHAVVAYADYLAINFTERGIGVSVLCPQAVDTDMIKPWPNGGIAGLDGIVSAKDLAVQTVAEVQQGKFLILPHAKVRDYAIGRAQDHERWLQAMRKTAARINEQTDSS